MATAIVDTLKSLKDRPRSYRLTLAAGVIAVLVVLAVLVGAVRGLDLSGLAASDVPATPAAIRAEIAALRAQTAKLAADLKSFQTDLRDAAALPKDAKQALQQQQSQKALKDLAERLERLEQVIITNPAKALEFALLQRDLEQMKAAQQQGLAAIGEALGRAYTSTRWVLAGLAVSLLLLVFGLLLKGKEP